MLTEKNCIYCNNNYEHDSEHVFPDGLGGENKLIDCVCEKCNNFFSHLERELIQNSPASLMRSVEGVKSSRKKAENAYYKAKTLLIFDEENKIVYEVCQHDKFKILLRPQLIQIEDKFFFESSPDLNFQVLIDRIKKWQKDSLIVIDKFPNIDNPLTIYLKYTFNLNKISYSEHQEKIKVKNVLIIEILGSDHELHKYLKPRIFIDDNGNLKVRAASKDEATKFVSNLIVFLLNPYPLMSFAKEINDNKIVYVGQQFDGMKAERAMVKICLNILVHYFPQTRNHSALTEAILFVKQGTGNISAAIGKKSELLDLHEKSHNIVIQQVNNNISLRLSLFNGNMVYGFLIPGLKLFSNKYFNQVIIEYRTRKNILLTKEDVVLFIRNSNINLKGN